MAEYDVVVAGGSVAGLTFAAEAARRGISVLVAEEHAKIGEPEKCDGLVSLRGLRRYGFAPGSGVIQNEIASGLIHSPGGGSLAVNATGLDVVVLDRSEYDMQLAEKAISWGAEVRTGARVSGFAASQDGVAAMVGGERVSAKYFIDCTGPASSPRGGILSAAKYEIEAPWVMDRVVEVYLDREKYPGFFAWVIPSGGGRAKVGAAGRGINAFRALDGFLSGREHRVLRRVAAPIYVGGPAQSYVSGRRVLVGESAGQVKPTTAGGITTSVAAGVIAARWVSDSIQLGDLSLVNRYKHDWDSRFGREMAAMSRLRRAFEMLSNDEIDRMIDSLSSSGIARKLSEADFDFHATSLLGALGIGGLLRLAGLLASAEARSLLVGRAT